MHDQKMINAMVSKIANRGGSSNQSPTPGGFAKRMSDAKAAKKTARTASVPSRASSNAPPSQPQANKTQGKNVAVAVPKTTVPDVKKGKKGPTMQTGPGGKGTKGGHTFNLTVKY